MQNTPQVDGPPRRAKRKRGLLPLLRFSQRVETYHGRQRETLRRAGEQDWTTLCIIYGRLRFNYIKMARARASAAKLLDITLCGPRATRSLANEQIILPLPRLKYILLWRRDRACKSTVYMTS